MSSNREYGPVYYREIQKNAYLKRIPEESGSRLRPMGHKKPPLKPMWTLFCVHNGRTPFLEQYTTPESATMTHKPVWAVCLQRARHVTASVKPRLGNEYDFLVDTDAGPIRMLAPDWESMQDWVTTLRSKLQELKVVGGGSNVYSPPAAPAVPPPPRAGTRDPNSPLPPVPPLPVQRVPGIEITTPIPRQVQQPTEIAQTTDTVENTNPTQQVTTNPTVNCNPTQQTSSKAFSNLTQQLNPSVNSNLNQQNTSNLSVNTNPTAIQSTSVTLNPTQAPNPNVNFNPDAENLELTSLDESIDISNWDNPFSSLPSTSTDTNKSVTKISGQSICLDDSILRRKSATESDEEFFSQIDQIHASLESLDDSDVASVTEGGSVQKDKRNEFKQRVLVNNEKENVQENGLSDYQGPNVTVIQVSNRDPPHTAIPVLGPEVDVFNFDFKQKLNIKQDTSEKEENFINIVNTEVNVQNSNDNGYGTVFSKTENDYGHLSLTTTVNLTGVNVNVTDNDGVYERLCMASTSKSPLPIRKIRANDKIRKSSLPNLDFQTCESPYEYLYPGQSNNNRENVSINHSGREVNREHAGVCQNGREVDREHGGICQNEREVNREHGGICQNGREVNLKEVSNGSNVNVSAVNVSAPVESNVRVIRANVERSHSQNTYDTSPRRERVRRTQNSPKREVKCDKSEPSQPKPIWKRGLTELSLLSKFRGRGQKRQESPNRADGSKRVSLKVVHRSRVEGRTDPTRRRSSSLSNGSPPSHVFSPLRPLRCRQGAMLVSEQARGALPAAVSRSTAMVLAEYNRQVWVAWWAGAGLKCGDRVVGVAGTAPRDLAHAKQLFKTNHKSHVDILFHRVPLAKIFVLNKRDQESIGLKLDSECTITSVEPGSPAGRAGVTASGALTEVNNRPLNLIKGGEEEMNRLSLHGTEVLIVIHPVPLVKKLRAAVKAHKNIFIR